MKRLLLLSLLLNAALAVAVWLHPAATQPVPRPLRGEVRAPAAPGGARITDVRPSRSAEPTPWSWVEHRDPARLVTALRAVGCPEETIRDLVVARVCRRYRSQMLASEEARARSWDYTRNRPRADWQESRWHQEELRNQMLTELETLLGPEFAAYRARVLGWDHAPDPDYLGPDQRRQVRELQTRYRQLREDLESDRTLGTLDAAGAARLAELARQQRAELATLLSPSELAEYVARDSPAARFVLGRLPGAKSEAEFRAIVNLADAFGLDPSLGNDLASRYPGAPVDDAQHQADAARLAEFNRQLQELLGSDRAAEREAESQADAEQQAERERERREQEEQARLARIAATAGVSAEDATRFLDRLKALQPELQPRLEAFEKELTGTPEERRRQMDAAVTAELDKVAVEVLGNRGPAFVRAMKERER